MSAVRAPNVGAVIEDGVVYAAVLPDGPIFVLTDGAADAWHAAVGTDPAHAADRAHATVRAHAAGPGLDGYTTALVDAGLLVIEKEE